MTTILLIWKLLNFIICIFSAIICGMSFFDDPDYTYKDICVMYLFDCLLFPIYVYREFNENYNVIGSLIVTILSMFVWIGVACGGFLTWILRTITGVFNRLFKKKENN